MSKGSKDYALLKQGSEHIFAQSLNIQPIFDPQKVL